LFSFIIFVISIVFTKYLLDVYVFKIYFYFAPLYVGVALGLVRFLFNYSNYIKKLAVVEKEQEIKLLRELKTRTELNALQSKINPHFLYNALNSIAGLAHENADKVEQMAIALSKLFRYSINKEDTDFATVQNEVEMVAIYLEIEKIRFEDRLEYSIEVADEAKDKKIPMFVIQPLIENAIKHGIANVAGKAMLTLAIFFDNKKLYIRVGDNGPAFPEDLITGFGLQGIYEKLDILYSGHYEIKIHNGADKNISIILG
jgi:LytS/YehU family sensor histidine kinase